MKHNFPILILAIFIISVFITELLRLLRKNRELLRLYTEYEVAKLSGEKEKAFEAGKAFYKRKKGTVTAHDEQILEMDLKILKWPDMFSDFHHDYSPGHFYDVSIFIH